MSISIVAIILGLSSLGASANNGEFSTNVSASTPCNKICPFWSITLEGCCEVVHHHERHLVHSMKLNNKEVLLVKNCYCLYYEDNRTIIGQCFYTCYNQNGTFQYLLERVESGTEFNEKMCSGSLVGLEFNRQGKLCGRCKEGYGIPLYSYHLTKCVLCKKHYYQSLKYIAIAYGPLTLFYIIVVMFRITITSGDMNGYIFFSQAITSPIQMRFFIGMTKSIDYSLRRYATALKIVYSFYGIWNLDFFRLLYNPFCIHPKVDIRHTLFLDYLIAMYPLVLIIFTYIFVVLHSKGYRLILCIWRPFHKCLARFRSHWNIKTSLVHAFSTFLLLSSVKILYISFDLLLPAKVWDLKPDGLKVNYYYYYDAASAVFDRAHSFDVIVVIFSSLLCVVLPLLVFCAYPFRCFHKILNCLKCKCTVPHIFMDTFVGCYRHEPTYCRAFAGVYFFLRLLLLLNFLVTLSLLLSFSLSIVAMLAAILFIIARPYKRLSLNVIDVVFLVYLAICFSINNQIILTNETYGSEFHHSLLFIYVCLLLLPIFYPAYFVLKFLYHSSIVQKLLEYFKSKWKSQKSEEIMESNQICVYRYGAI